jgi:hypothetical protein
MLDQIAVRDLWARPSARRRPLKWPSSADRHVPPGREENPMGFDDETVPCWLCPHGVDEHDERARCIQATCSCGW